jgi:hypothetical protein
MDDCGEVMTLIQTETASDGTTQEHMVAFICRLPSGHEDDADEGPEYEYVNPTAHLDEGVEDNADGTESKWTIRWTVEKC